MWEIDLVAHRKQYLHTLSAVHLSICVGYPTFAGLADDASQSSAKLLSFVSSQVNVEKDDRVPVLVPLGRAIVSRDGILDDLNRNLHAALDSPLHVEVERFVPLDSRLAFILNSWRLCYKAYLD
jgi:hypothetical protein